MDITQEQLDNFAAKFNVASLAPRVREGFSYMLIGDQYLDLDHKIYLTREPQETGNIVLEKLSAGAGFQNQRELALFKDPSVAADFACACLSTKNDIGLLQLEIVQENPDKVRITHSRDLPNFCSLD